MTTAVPTVAYRTAGFVIYNLTVEQLARIEAMILQAAADFMTGKPVVEVVVSTLELDEPRFRVPTGDFAELRKMVEGHLQEAYICRLGEQTVSWMPSMGF